MNTQHSPLHEPLAHALAVLIASKGEVKDSEWSALSRANAFGKVGVDPARFVEMANNCAQRIGPCLTEHQWLDPATMAQIDVALDGVEDLDKRLLICELAAQALATGDRRSGYDALVLDHALARWHLMRADIAPRAAAE